MRFYRIFGVLFASEVELWFAHAESPRPSGAGLRGVIPIELGELPTQLEEPTWQNETLQVKPGEILVSVPKVGRFWVRPDGLKVQAHPQAGEQDWLFQNSLLKNGLYPWSLLQGWLPLHAASLRYEGRIFLLIGGQGAGKSTTALGLQKKLGAEILSDDVAMLDLQGEQLVQLPGIPSLRLRNRLLEVFPLAPVQAEFTYKGGRKTNHRLPMPANATGQPLAAIYCLQQNSQFGSPTPLTKASALIWLATHTHHHVVFSNLPLRQNQHLKAQGKVAQQVPCYLVNMMQRAQPHQIEAQWGRLADHLCSLV